MADKKTTVADRVAEIAAPEAEKLGLSIWDVFYGKEGQDRILRITIDKPEGIFISDCEALSRAVDPLLDEAGFITDAYRFEVSSPGLGRRIHSDRQFEKYLGKEVAARLIRPGADGKREFSGILKAFDDTTFTVSARDGDITADRNAVSYVKADDDKFFQEETP